MKKNKATNCILVISLIYFALFLLFFLKALFTNSLNYHVAFMTYGGTFKYHYADIFGLRISLYWAMHIIGIIGMIVMCFMRRKKYGYSGTFSIITAIMLAVLGYVGAKLLYTFENWEQVQLNGLTLSGVSFFGTVFFMPIALFLMAKLARIDYKDYLDYCTPAGLLMLTSIRTGCFLNGCCHGIMWWYKGRPVIFPSQLLECALDLLLMYLLFRMKDKIDKGMSYMVFMGGYGILRFAVEFTRDTEKSIMHMSHGQWFSIICVVIAAAVLIINKFANKKRGSYAGK